MKRRLSVALVILVLAGCSVGSQRSSLSHRAPEQPVPTQHTVLLIGDSLMVQAATYVHAALLWHGLDVTVVDHSAGATGLLDPGSLQAAAEEMDGVPAASVVVFEYSGNCFFDCSVLPGSPDLYTMWEQAMRELIAGARQRGLVPMWVKSPPFAGDPGHARVVQQLATIDEAITRELGISMPDWWEALSDSADSYQPVLWYADGFAAPTWHVVRDVDGIHLALDGARRAATWTAAAVRDQVNWAPVSAATRSDS